MPDTDTALTTGKVTLPRNIFSTMLDKAKDASTIAQLATQEPKKFEEGEALIFTPSAEAEVVTEGAAKSSYEQKMDSVKAYTVTFQTTTRVSDQLKWADEDHQLKIVSNIVKDQGEAAGRLLDYIIYHLFNPLPKTALTLGDFQKLSAAAVQVTDAGDAVTNLDALEAAIGDVYEINGLAMSRKFARSLRTARNSQGIKLYPEVPMNLKVGSVDGVRASVSGTVNGTLMTGASASNVLAFMGNFNLINWGMVRAATSEVIEYGDPDGKGDLKRFNQIAYRTEGVLAYYVLDPKGFAVLKGAAAKTKAAR